MGGGKRIAGRYVLSAEIGAGGMGVVWRARDEKLVRDVAVKLLALSAVGNDTARARLLREARAAAQLQDDTIVRVYDVGETDDGGAFLVMELVAGKTLRDRLEEGTLSVRQRIEIALAVAGGLSHAHAEGILHRDIKPDNILVRKDGKPVILDFGLAKPITAPLADTIQQGKTEARITREGDIVGTPAYLAPEQIKGADVGPATDQLALAVTTFELLTGRLPWKGGNALEVIGAILHQEPLVASSLTPGLPTALDDVLLRAMKKDPAERFASLADFAKALEDATTELRAETSSPRVVVQAPDSAAGEARTLSAVDSTPSVKAPAPRLRSRTPWLVGGALAAAAVIGGALRHRPATVQPAGHDAGIVVAAADQVVACPPFAASGVGVEPPTGWLGAAGATLACERVQILLGGASSKTLLPAELVPGIAREPVDNMPDDPFTDAASEGARKAAHARGTSWLDGKIEKRPHDYRVTIDVRRSSDDQVVAHGSGTAVELFEAVSSAVREARGAFGDDAPSAFQREWMRVSSKEAALDLHDLVTALLVEDPVDQPRFCQKVRARKDIGPDMMYVVRATCARRVERVPFDEPPPAIDEGAPSGALVTAIAAHRAVGGLDEVKKRLARLKAIATAATSDDERAIASATAAEVAYLAGDSEGASSAARMAIQASPKLVDLRGSPWYRLGFTAEFDPGVASVGALWMPWSPVGTLNSSFGSAHYKRRLELATRAYLLGQRGFFPGAYAELLAQGGRTVQAAGVAEELDDPLLRMRVAIGEARYNRVLQGVTEQVASLPADDKNAGLAFRMSGLGAEAARFLGRPADFVDTVVTRYLDVEPPRVRGLGLVPFESLVDACLAASAPVAKRCIKRLHVIYTRGDAGAVFGGAPALLEGAEAWAAGDVHGATKAWRPLLRIRGAVAGNPIRHSLAEAFDKAGLAELADKLDAPFYDYADEPGGMDLALVRGARRAQARGDRVLAKKLATACVEKFAHADDDVPLRDLQAIAR